MAMLIKKKMKCILLLTTILIFLCSPAWAGTAYYVDLDAGSNGTGTFASPWNNIASVNSGISGTGDDVYFKAGTEKVVATYLRVDWTGTSEDRVIIGAYSGDGVFTLGGSARPIIDGNNAVPDIETQTYYSLIHIESNTVNYITVQDIHLKKSGTYGLSIMYSDYIIVYNCFVDHPGRSGILLAITHDSSVTDCTVEHANVNLGGSRVGIGVLGQDNATHTYNIHIAGNTVFDCKNEGIGVYKMVNDCVVEDNLVYDNSTVDIYVDAGKNNTIRNNICYTSSSYAPPSGRGVHIECEQERVDQYPDRYPYGENNRVYDNFISGKGAGIQLTTKAIGYVNTDNHVYNNTIVDCGYNLKIDNDASATGNYVYNNLSYQTDFSTSGYHFTNGNPSGFTFKNNYLNWNADPELYNITKAASGAVLMPTTDDPLIKSSGWSTIAAGAITWDNYLTDYFGLVLGVCVNAATNLTDVNDTGGLLTDVDVTDGKWFYGGSDDPLDNYIIGTDEVTLTGVTGDNIQWAGAKTIADNDLVYYRHFSGGLPDIGADEYTGTLTGGLQARWEFEDVPGILKDSETETAYDLTDHGTVANAAGLVGEHAVFNGTDQWLDRVGAADDFGWSTTKQFTLVFTLNLTTLPAAGDFRTMITKGAVPTTDDYDIGLFITDDGTPSFYIGYNSGASSESQDYTSANIVVGQNYRGVISFNNSGATVEGLADNKARVIIWDYTEGEYLGTPAGDNEELTFTNEWDPGQGGAYSIGRYNAAYPFYWVGSLDGIRLYNSVLSVADMKALINPQTSMPFFHCDSDYAQIDAETIYTASDTCRLCIGTPGGANIFAATGPLTNLQIGTDMSYPDKEEFDYAGGIGTPVVMFARVIRARDRDGNLQAEDTAGGIGLIHGATVLYYGGTEAVYTLAQADPAGGNIIISAGGTWTIGAGGDFPLWSDGSTGFHDILYDEDKDKFNIPDPVTDDFVISADNVRIRGTGGNVAITGGIELLGACTGTIIKCLTFSNGITDNDNDYVYQENCRGGVID